METVESSVDQRCGFFETMTHNKLMEHRVRSRLLDRGERCSSAWSTCHFFMRTVVRPLLHGMWR